MALPFVSVIIPVLNDAAELTLTLQALNKQSYPPDNFEVIIVDNGSNDGSVEVARQNQKNIVLFENRHFNSPYSARNRGLEHAKGTVIGLLDATCVPEPGWLSEGIRALEANGADMVGCNVLFRFASAAPSAGELYDAMNNIRMRESVLQRNIAKTAALLIRRVVFDRIGAFPEDLRSGGDVMWTKRATGAGFKLVYCESSVVYKSARRFWPLIGKQWRVAKGQPAIWREEEREVHFIKNVLAALIPPRLSTVYRLASAKGPLYKKKYLRLWLIQYTGQILMRFGNLYATWQYIHLRGGKTNP